MDFISPKFIPSKEYALVYKEVMDIKERLNKELSIVPDTRSVLRDLGVETSNDGNESEEEEIIYTARTEDRLMERDDIDLEEKKTINRKLVKFRDFMREKLKLRRNIDRLEELNDIHSGKSLRERIADLYKQHQKVSIAFLVGVVSLVIGSIITAIIEAVGVESTTSGSDTSDGGGGDSGGSDDKKSTVWQKVKKVILWILEKLLSMIGSIVAFILNLIKKAVKEMRTTVLIGLTATISAIIYFFIYGTQEKMHKLFSCLKQDRSLSRSKKDKNGDVK